MISVIVGAGIVGLHVAGLLRDKGHEVFVLEQEPYLAEHTSGRNSGVIHSGVFYETGSLKERLCIEGNRLTYEWLERLRVPYVPCGKWIVPEAGQEKDLEPFFQRIRRLPIPSPSIKSPSEVADEEPNLRASRAILIPSTGILDAAAYVKAMARYLEENGVQVILSCRVLEVAGNTLMTTRGEIRFDMAVNVAGLFADDVARMTDLERYEILPCRGDYYLVSKPLVRRPVYHLPYEDAHGLGIHLTPTLDGQLLLGPNAFFIEQKNDYAHRTSPEVYERAVRHFLPRVSIQQLVPAYSGNRPKLFRDGKALNEFTIERVGSWIHLLGIESPGLTAAPSIAREILGLVA